MKINYSEIIKQKNNEIDNMKKEMNVLRKIINLKPKILNETKLNENYLNNPKSLISSNKNHSKSMVKFELKNNINEKIPLFSERSPNFKNSNNNINYNYLSSNNHNSCNTKNFMEIFNNYDDNKATNLNNFSNEIDKINNNNHIIIKQNNILKKNPNLSSSLSNFFRKSNIKNKDNKNISLFRGSKGKF